MALQVSECGHRLCRPCALRTIKHNIGQQEAQCCPSCMGAACPSCPTTTWKRRVEAFRARQERKAAEAGSSTAVAPPEPPPPPVRFCIMSQVPYPAGIYRGIGYDSDSSQDGKSLYDYAFCCSTSKVIQNMLRLEAQSFPHNILSLCDADLNVCIYQCQADMRLLLQPEELQNQQQDEERGQQQQEAAAEADPPPSPPPSFEAYLKAEALRLAHQTDLFKLCPKCGGQKPGWETGLFTLKCGGVTNAC